MVNTHLNSLVAQSVKNLPAVQETGVPSLDWQDPLEKEMATHSNILFFFSALISNFIALLSAYIFYFFNFLKFYFIFKLYNIVSTPISLPGKSHGQRNLVGCSPGGCKESGPTEWRTLTGCVGHILGDCSLPLKGCFCKPSHDLQRRGVRARVRDEA